MSSGPPQAIELKVTRTDETTEAPTEAMTLFDSRFRNSSRTVEILKIVSGERPRFGMPRRLSASAALSWSGFASQASTLCRGDICVVERSFTYDGVSSSSVPGMPSGPPSPSEIV